MSDLSQIPDWLRWVDSLGPAAAMAFGLWALATDRVVSRETMKRAVEAGRGNLSAEVRLLRERVDILEDTLSRVRIDRDAWQDAHRAQAAATAEISAASRALVEQSDLAVALLDTLRGIVENDRRRG